MKVRSGRSHASWARRRAEPVATVAPGARSSRRAPTMTSRGSARSGTQARTSPSGVTEGRSLAECTASIGAAVEHGQLHLLDEHPLAAELADAGRRPARRRWS